VEYLQKMQMLLHCVGASDPRLMDKSSLRCDVNVSVNRFVRHRQPPPPATNPTALCRVVGRWSLVVWLGWADPEARAVRSRT
jgi:hypothetical protein